MFKKKQDVKMQKEARAKNNTLNLKKNTPKIGTLNVQKSTRKNWHIKPR